MSGLSYENPGPPDDSYIDRNVSYIVKPEYYGPNTGTIKTINSGELSTIKDPNLKCALRIADVMQALDFPKPEFGPAGGVTEIQMRDPSRIYGRFVTKQVIDAFPDDIMTQIAEQGMVSDS